MIEYKFRAWDIKNNKLLTPKEIYLDLHYQFQISCFGDIALTYDDGDNINTDFELMQYTGLKDKNGNEIYVGDILKVTHPTTGTVRIGEVLHGSLARIQIKGKDIHCAFNHISSFEWEVIGNIYENAELIREE